MSARSSSCSDGFSSDAIRRRERGSNPRSPGRGYQHFRDRPNAATINRPASQNRILTIEQGRFIVCLARLAPAMISTPGHRASRRRQRGDNKIGDGGAAAASGLFDAALSYLGPFQCRIGRPSVVVSRSRTNRP
jgi:hypothetical protein